MASRGRRPSNPWWSRVARPATLVAVGLTAAACYPKAGSAPPPLSAGGAESASARWPGVTVSSLAAGREIFLAKCNGCHDYPDLASVSEGDWPHVLDSMAKKSHLDTQGRDAVLHFVLASRADQAAR